MTWTGGAGEYLDLQYSQILRIEHMVAIMYVTNLHSNTFRNALMRSKRRIYDDGHRHPVTPILPQALRSQGVPVRVAFKYSYCGVAGDADVIAIIGGGLFVFECKYTLLPCSAFEQRTFFDYLDKAALQLEKVQKLWADDAFRAYLGRSLRWDLSQVERIYTVIVPSIRLLSGVNYLTHPVRYLRELANFIECGKAAVRDRDERYDVDLWKGRRFGEEVMREYLASSSPLYEPVWQSMEAEYARFGTARWELSYPKYGLDLEKYGQEMAKMGLPKLASRRDQGAG